MLTGSPGAGKSSVIEALTTLLGNAGIEYGAIETEQLGWGVPWLPPEEEIAMLGLLVRRQGRARHLVVATTETEAHLQALLDEIGAERTFVACVAAPPEVVRQRVLDREPAAWAGREPLAAHAFELASVIPQLPGVDLVVSTEGRRREDVAGGDPRRARGARPDQLENENDAVPSRSGQLSTSVHPKVFTGFRAAGLATPWPRSLRLGSASGTNISRRPAAVNGAAQNDPASSGKVRVSRRSRSGGRPSCGAASSIRGGGTPRGRRRGPWSRRGA